MAPFFSEWFRRGLVVCLPLILLACGASLSSADECKRVSNILVLFDASGFMKDQNRYQQLLEQMGFFEKAVPLTRDGLFNVGLRHYGLKVGLGCENTESILAVQPWDPQRFLTKHFDIIHFIGYNYAIQSTHRRYAVMKKHFFTLLVAVALICAAMACTALSQTFNPYLPHNAPAAQPPTPWYLRAIPHISTEYYDPCLSCGPLWTHFPDWPPFALRGIGPFGIAVPLP